MLSASCGLRMPLTSSVWSTFAKKTRRWHRCEESKSRLTPKRTEALRRFDLREILHGRLSFAKNLRTLRRWRIWQSSRDNANTPQSG
jgi:hypothetical protein